MDDRTALHTTLQEIFPDLTLYFNPPSNLILSYPCIVYKMLRLSTKMANNTAYSTGTIYQVTILDNTAEFTDLKKIMRLPYVSHVNTFTLDDITNYVFNVRVNTI